MNKFLLLSAAALTAASATAADEITVKKCEEAFLVESMSANGNFVVGQRFVWNVETGALITNEDSFDLVSVDNNGTAVGSVGDYAAKLTNEGELILFAGLDEKSVAKGISADGSIIVGSTFDDNWFTTAGYWTNDEFHALPVPEEIEDVAMDDIMGYRAIGVNEDGSVIVGNLVVGSGAGAVVAWTRDTEGEYEFKAMFEGLMEFGWEEVKPYILMNAECISANGKWIGVSLQKNDWFDETWYMGRLNVETGEVVMAGGFDDEDIASYYPSAVSNDGTIIGFTELKSATMYGRQGIIWTPESEAVEYFVDYCDNNAEVAELAANEAFVPTGISADGAKVSGFAMSSPDIYPFLIELPGSITGVETVAATAADSTKTVYDLQGNRVNGDLKAGIYIVVENGVSKKVMVK